MISQYYQHTLPELSFFRPPDGYMFGSGYLIFYVFLRCSAKMVRYLVSSKMVEKGWNLNILQNPKSFHLCLTNLHLINQAKNDFINDLKDSVKYAKNQPNDNSKGTAAIYGMAKNIPDKSIVKEVATAYLDSLTEK